MVMQYRSLFLEISRSEAGRKPSHSSSMTGCIPAAERLAAKAKLQARKSSLPQVAPIESVRYAVGAM